MILANGFNEELELSSLLIHVDIRNAKVEKCVLQQLMSDAGYTTKAQCLCALQYCTGNKVQTDIL